MSSWIGYSVYPVTDTDPEELRRCLTESVTESAIETSRHGKDRLVPCLQDDWGCVGRRCSTSTINPEALHSELADWFDACAELIDVAYLARMSDTTDAGTVAVFKPTEYGLVEVEERSVSYTFEGDRQETPGQLFPEDGAKLESRGGGEDHIQALTAEYGHRPLLYYG